MLEKPSASACSVIVLPAPVTTGVQAVPVGQRERACT